jgi:hypothetical protein
METLRALKIYQICVFTVIWIYFATVDVDDFMHVTLIFLSFLFYVLTMLREE